MYVKGAKEYPLHPGWILKNHLRKKSICAYGIKTIRRILALLVKKFGL